MEGFTRQMKKLPAFLRQSLTYDRGSEMACHADLSKRLKLDVWFCDPHAPWQRGSNENTNGLLRQFLPKGTDLSLPSQTMLNDIARLLNGRPRQTLGWRTPPYVRLLVASIHLPDSGAKERTKWHDTDKPSKIGRWRACCRRRVPHLRWFRASSA